ncbi:MAG: dihydrofolate reductase [Bacteroidetes bacterium]|nr:dihydrofolate reductase [Bacteroidota bacterium]
MKTTVYIGTSLDGFIARNNGDIEWLMQYATEELMEPYQALMDRIDTILMGRGTFEKVLTFPAWPFQKPIYVLSTTLTAIPETYVDKVSIISKSPGEALQFLSEKGYHNVYIDGGKVIQSFLSAGLVNELIISTVPVLIGNGIPLFGQLDHDVKFKHQKTNVYKNGLVMNFYEQLQKIAR